jgi:outer membrane PBP1 activator LpoA protein
MSDKGKSNIEKTPPPKVDKGGGGGQKPQPKQSTKPKRYRFDDTKVGKALSAFCGAYVTATKAEQKEAKARLDLLFKGPDASQNSKIQQNQGVGKPKPHYFNKSKAIDALVRASNCYKAVVALNKIPKDGRSEEQKRSLLRGESEVHAYREVLSCINKATMKSYLENAEIKLSLDDDVKDNNDDKDA